MAHKLLSTDDFGDVAIANNSGPRWTYPTLYWPTLIWNAGTTDPTGFNLSPEWPGLHDGYQEQYGGVTSMILPGGQSLSRKSQSFVFRGDQRADVTVKGEFAFSRVGGGAIDFYNSNYFCGLGARIQGASGCDFQAESRYLEALRAPTGYWFMLMSRWTGSHAILRMAILKITGPSSAGAASGVEQLVASTYSLNGETVITPAVPFKLRFVCTNNAGVAELTAHFYDPIRDEEFEVLTYEDGSGAILGEGHSGFLLTSELDDPTGTSDHEFINLINAFEIQDSSNDIIIRDEFRRTHTNQMDFIGPDLFGRSGYVVTGAFTGDQAGKSISGEIPDFKDRLLRHASLEKLEVDDTPGGGFHIPTNPAANAFVQASAVDFEYGSGTSTSRIVGACVRMSVRDNANWETLSSNDVVGYILAVHYFGGIWALRMHAQSQTGYEVIAFRVMNVSGDPVTLAVTTTFTLRLDVENRDGQNPATGNVHLSPTIDGELFTGWTILEDGVIEESDGTLTDSRTERVLSGTGVGFYANASGAEDLFIHKYDRPAVTFALDEREQGSVFLGRERDGLSGSLTVNHEWGVTTRYLDYGEAIRFESGHVHTHGTTTSQRRAWKIHSDAATAAEVDGLEEFFEQQEALETPFHWITPEGETVAVMHGAPTLKVTKVTAEVYQFEVELYELLGEDYAFEILNFQSSAVPASGGGLGIVDSPQGTRDFPVFHFPDDFGSFTFRVQVTPAAPLGGIKFTYTLSGTAVEGTHYDVASGSENPVTIPAGQTTADVTIDITNTGKWHEEKVIIINLGAATEGTIHPIDNELRAIIHSTTIAPEVSFATPSQNVARGATANMTVAKSSGANDHEDDAALYFEHDTSAAANGSLGAAVEGTDFEWPLVTGPHGLFTMEPDDTSVIARVNILPSATPGRTVVLNLAHDYSDQSDLNEWSMTHDMRTEEELSVVKTYPGYPSDNSPGPAGSLPPEPYNIFHDGTLLTPYGEPVWVIEQGNQAIGPGYHRKSSKSMIWCAGPPDGLSYLERFTRVSIFVRKATNYTLPRFFQIGVRNRGFTLDPPQNNNGSDADHWVVFDTRSPNSGAIPFDGGTWDVYETSNNWLSTGEYGIKQETHRMSDGSLETLLRFWIIYNEGNAALLGNASNIIWWPVQAKNNVSGASFNDNFNKAIACFWPTRESSNTSITGEPERFRPRKGYWPTPIGNCTVPNGGTTAHTITIT